jgi:hypothetical protein
MGYRNYVPVSIFALKHRGFRALCGVKIEARIGPNNRADKAETQWAFGF